MRPGGGRASRDVDLSLDLDGDVEGKLGEADRAPAMAADVGAEELEDDVGEPVDDARLHVEAGRRVDHSEYARPCGDSIEIAERALQAAEDGERREASRSVALLDGQLAPELAQRLGEGSVRVLGSVAGDERTVADEAHELKREQDSGRRFHGRWKGEAQSPQSLLNV